MTFCPLVISFNLLSCIEFAGFSPSKGPSGPPGPCPTGPSDWPALQIVGRASRRVMSHLLDYYRYQRFRFRRSACCPGSLTGWLAAEVAVAGSLPALYAMWLFPPTRTMLSCVRARLQALLCVHIPRR